MKCFVIFLLILLNVPALASKDESQMLKCLGEEEKKFHLKKETGPLYDLNQRMISEMIQIPKAELTQEHFNDICSKTNFSPAWKLLELSISKGKDIFEIPKGLSGTQKEVAVGMIDDFLEITSEIVLNFITQVQAAAPSATCLKEEVPDLDAFFNDIKYLQEDVEIKKIFAGRDVKIFEKLKDFPLAFQRCRERLKKKLKSESKPAPKKS